MPETRIRQAFIAGSARHGALRGAGDTRVPFAMRIVLAWAFFLPMAWLLAAQAVRQLAFGPCALNIVAR